MDRLARLEARDAEAAIERLARRIVENAVALDVRRVASDLRDLVAETRHARLGRSTPPHAEKR